MTWLRRLSVLLAGMVLAVMLILATVFVLFDAADYKRTLSWIADRLFDSELTIDGVLSLRYTDNLVLDIGDVRLDARDGSYLFSCNTLHAGIQLRPLLSGTLWLEDLLVRQFSLKLKETSTRAFDLQALAAVPVIVASADFEDLVVEYQEEPPGTLHRFTLTDLLLEAVEGSGPISVHANGQLDGRAYRLQGTLPPMDDVLDPAKAKPVDLQVSGKQGRVQITGNVTDPVNGKGMDLQIELVTRDTTQLLEILGDGIPDVGDLAFAARLRGDYKSPQLDQIEAHLTRGGAVDFRASGSVDDVFTGAGLNLDIEGHSDQPDVASWLLFGKLGQLKSLAIKGAIQAQGGDFYISGLDAAATTSLGMSVTAQGKAELYRGDHLFLKSDSGINVTFTAPSTAALNLMGVADIPELGGASGRFRLLVSTDSIGLYDLDARIGKQSTSSVHLQGQVRDIPLLEGAGATAVDLQLSVQSPDVAALAKELGYSLPAIGAADATAHLTGDSDTLKMKQVYIRAGDLAGIQLTAKGNVGRLVPGKTLQLDQALFDVAANTRDLGKLSELTGVNFPERMPASLSGTMTLRQSVLLFDDMRINIGRKDQPVIRMQGEARTLLHKGSSIQINYNVAVADLVAAYSSKTPGYLGRIEGSADVSDIDGSWGIEKFNLVSSQTTLYQINIHGGFDDLKNKDLININVNLAINDPAGLGNALGINLSGLKASRHEGLLTNKDNKIVYDGTLSIGKTTGTTLIHGHTHRDAPYFTGTISIPVLDLTDFGFRLERKAEYEVIPRPESSGKDYLFSRQPLDVEFLNNFGLDLQVNIDEIENYGQSSIDSFVGHLTLQDGELEFDPLRFTYAGGALNIRFGLHATKPPAYRLNVAADDLILGPMMTQVQKNTPIEGRTNVKLDVTTSGYSAHQLAANLDGAINVELENARLPPEIIDYLFIDVFGWAFSKTINRDKYINLNCVVAHFTAAHGELESRLLVADGPNMSAGGRVDLNLRDETISAVLLPKQKRRLFSAITPVRLSGPIKSPHVLAIPAQAAIQEIGTLALSPTIYLSTRLLGKIWSAVRSGGDVGKGCINIDKLTDKAEKTGNKEPVWQGPDYSEVLVD
jgi:hypothetical protein